MGWERLIICVNGGSHRRAGMGLAVRRGYQNLRRIYLFSYQDQSTRTMSYIAPFYSLLLLQSTCCHKAAVMKNALGQSPRINEIINPDPLPNPRNGSPCKIPWRPLTTLNTGAGAQLCPSYHGAGRSTQKDWLSASAGEIGARGVLHHCSQAQLTHAVGIKKLPVVCSEPDLASCSFLGEYAFFWGAGSLKYLADLALSCFPGTC